MASDLLVTNADSDAIDSRIAAVDTTFYANANPFLHVQLIRGSASIAEGGDVEDVFPSTTSVTEVLVTIVPPSGEDIEVYATSGPEWSQDPTSGNWQATFAMPSAGGTTLGEFDVIVDPEGSALTCTGKFKVKKAGTGTSGG